MTMTLSGDGTITGLVAGGLPDATVTADDLAAGAALNNAPNSVGFRNRIINGDMRIDQRNAGASGNTDGFFPVDRWITRQVGASAKFSVQQSSVAAVGFTNSLIFTSLSAYSVGSTDFFGAEQRIEGFNTADLGWGTANAKTVTLSFWVRSSLTGTFGGSLRNNAADRSYPFTYTISAANTYEYKSVTITGDTAGTWLTTNGIGIRLVFSLGTGSTLSGTAGAWAGANYTSATGATSVVGTDAATWYITGVQLEVGSVATPFERRPFGLEFMLCQRYYQTISQVPAVGSTSTVVQAFGVYPTIMRAGPTVGATGNLNYQGDGIVNTTQSSISFANNFSNNTSLNVTVQNFTGIVQSRTLYLAVTANNGNVITLSAEL
jgi:hypothetical protein